MDVSGWTLDQRMCCPDWCFGNQQVICAYGYNATPASFTWYISEDALPDPVCIWQAAFISMPSTGGTGHMRVGLANEVPTSEAEMDAAVEVFPGMGDPRAGPNRIQLYATTFVFWTQDMKKGIVTGGKKLVIENFCNIASMRVGCNLVVSGLPTQIPAHLDRNTV